MNVVAMAPVVLECPNAECALGADGARYETQALEPAIAMEMLKLHHQNHSLSRKLQVVAFRIGESAPPQD